MVTPEPSTLLPLRRAIRKMNTSSFEIAAVVHLCTDPSFYVALTCCHAD
jgi:hypothetical protein